MNILAIESSCDETAAAVIQDGVNILSQVVATSHDMHEKYGGIVPEVAARMQLESIIPTITESLKIFNVSPKASMLDIINDHIDALAITIGPGLIGSLLVGVETAKTIAMTTNKPIIPVNHVLAHMYANFVRSERNDGKQSNENNKETMPYSKKPVQFPAISLVVSGGHTELYLMESKKNLTWLGGTIDDAAGECFDKTARLLGFGHGGGLSIQEAAMRNRASDRDTKNPIRLPRPMLDKDNELNFSFSGLKTAILRETQKMKSANRWGDEAITALSYEVQEAITDVLVKKTLKAIEKYDVRSVLLSGGVSANIRLREKLQEHMSKIRPDLVLHAPPIELCTDNAVYIGSYAFFRGEQTPWKEINAIPDLSVEVSS